MINVKQNSVFILVDYHPNEKNSLFRYSVSKGVSIETLELEPTEVRTLHGQTNGVGSALEEAIYLAAITHLAYQLDRLIKTRQDLQRSIEVKQVGLHFEVSFGEDTKAYECIKTLVVRHPVENPTTEYIAFSEGKVYSGLVCKTHEGRWAIKFINDTGELHYITEDHFEDHFKRMD